MQLMARQKEKPGQYDCTGCDRERRETRKCLMLNSTVTAETNGIPPINVSRETISELFAVWAETGRPELPELATLEQFGICPLPLITPFSAEALKLYMATDGLKRIRTPEEYYQQSALWIETCNLLDTEKAKWLTTKTN